MPTNYQGNPNVTRSPSAAPGPKVIPTVAQPNPGEPSTAASVAQAMDVAVDFIGHIQSAVALDVPVVAASGSGFTVPINTTGGTITPSGSVKISTGTRFVIQIQTGGIVGTATFKTSTDGGNTYGALQTTAASMTDATSGITLAFSGTFTASGTASFRSAYTPQARWTDQAGNGRWLIDNHGFPTGGRVSQFREEWSYVVNPLAPPQTQVVWPGTPWTYDITAAGGAIAVQAPSASYNARSLLLTPPSTGGGTQTALWGPQLFFANTPGMSAVMEFECGMNAAAAGTASKTDFWFGLQDGTDGPDTDQNVIVLHKLSTAANWEAYSLVAGALHTVTTTTAPTVGTFPTDRVRIVIEGSASAYGAYQALLFVNEALIANVVASSLPGAFALRPVFSAEPILGAPVGSPLAYVGPLTVTWNRFASGPAL